MRSPTVLRILRPPTQTEALFIGSILSAILLCTLIGKESVPHKVSRTNELARVKPFVPFPSDVSHLYEPLTVSEDGKNTEAENRKEASDAAAEVEALAALRAAEEVRLRGNSEKAFKLLRRAAALAPKQADVLTRLGEFLEEARRDVLAADLLYARALTTVPDHPVALAHRRRTAGLVENIDRDTLHKIELKRDALSAIPDSHAALRRAKKEAYYQHVYHTVGIEGNTMSLQQTRSILETKLAVAGKSIDEHNEILGLDAAMKFINSTLIHRMGEITVQDILEIHRRVLGYVDPTEGGYFRRTQVYVGGHIPPGPMFINVLMDQFLKWLNSDDALDMHPVRLAALAHYKLVHIHPFTDGNGRTSRLLMNLILMQAGYPPVIILKQHRHLYYQHLQTANEGDVRPFVRFIAECTERTLDLYLWATSEFSHQVPALAQPAILSEETFEDEIS